MRCLDLPSENVWDYPRPPKLEPVQQVLRVVHQGLVVAQSNATLRVLETSHPPTYYFPPEDVAMELLTPNQHRSFCEWKGQAHYFDLMIEAGSSLDVAWAYGNPVPAFNSIAGYLAFYASKFDECWVGNYRVRAQEGDFYGGWITDNLIGPFKGIPGSRGW